MLDFSSSTDPGYSSQQQPYTIPQNRRVACEPFPTNVVEKEVRHGIVVAKQKGTTTALRVVFRNGDICPGYLIYVNASLFMATWAKEIYETSGCKYILVPEDQILLIDPRPE